MAFPMLFPLLFVGASAVAIVVGAMSGRKYALTEDCQHNRLAELNPEELQDWFEKNVFPAFETAQAGHGVVISEPVAGEPVPFAVAETVAVVHAQLMASGLTHDQARALARIDGRRVYLPADPADPAEVAMFLYQKVSRSDCRIFRIANWSADVDTLPPMMVPDKKEIVWPSVPAQCLFMSLRVVVKMQLYALTGADRYVVTPADFEAVGAVCPQADWSPGAQPEGSFGVQPTPTTPSMPSFPAQPSGPVPMTPQFPSIPAQPGYPAPVEMGISVGAFTGPLNYNRMADDANRGTLHPAHVLNGAVFR